MSRFRFEQMARNFDKLKRDLPPVIGNMGQRFFAQNFVKQGFDNGTVQKWPPRKNDSKHDARRAILVKTGRLRAAVNRSLRSAQFTNILFEVSLPYAKIHNDGFRGIQNVRPHKRTRYGSITMKESRHNVRGYARRLVMPKRQFIGNSATLIRMIDGKISQSMSQLRK